MCLSQGEKGTRSRVSVSCRQKSNSSKCVMYIGPIDYKATKSFKPSAKRKDKNNLCYKRQKSDSLESFFVDEDSVSDDNENYTDKDPSFTSEPRTLIQIRQSLPNFIQNIIRYQISDTTISSFGFQSTCGLWTWIICFLCNRP